LQHCAAQRGGEGVESCAACVLLHHQQPLETAKQKRKDLEDWIHEKNKKKSGFTLVTNPWILKGIVRQSFWRNCFVSIESVTQW